MYFFGFFFDVRSAFKGRFQWILATISDQSFLNMIAMESRTQEDYEELKILLQNCLISSRFSRKLSLQKEEHLFIEKTTQKMRAVRFAEGILDSHNCAKLVGYDPMTWVHLFLKIRRLIFIGLSRCSHVLLHELRNSRLNRDCPMSLTGSTAHICARDFDEDPVDQSPRNRRVSIDKTNTYGH